MWGNMSIYALSYMHQFDDQLTIGIVLAVFPVTLTTAALSMQLAVVLMDHLTHKQLILIGTTIYSLGVFISVFFVNSFPLFLFFFSFVGGLGFGLTYVSPLKLCWEYFPNKKGTITGIINSGFSTGGIVYSFLSKDLINPNNQEPNKLLIIGGVPENMYKEDSEIVANFQKSLRTISLIIISMMLVGNLIVYQKTSSK